MPPRSDSPFQPDELHQEESDQFGCCYSYADPEEIAVGQPYTPGPAVAPVWGRNMYPCRYRAPGSQCGCHDPASRLILPCGICGCRPWSWPPPPDKEVSPCP